MELREELQRLYPLGQGLLEHEWGRHGTCTGLNQESYFSLVSKYNKRLNDMSSLVVDSIGSSINHKELLETYGGSDEHVYFICNNYYNDERQYLSQISSLWDRKGKPIEVNQIIPENHYV